MKKKVYFVHCDSTRNQRQSDGVEFCIIPDFYDEKIYFYCYEFDIYWKNIEEAGIPEKCMTLGQRQKKRIRPATLEEICNANLSKYVDSVKEYGRGIMDIKYIHLKEILWTDPKKLEKK